MLHWIKKKLPSKEALHKNKSLRLFGKILHKPELWEFHRATLTKAVAIGLFVAFIPLPMQMIIAAALAILFSANLPMSVACVWVTNPFTMPAIYYACYKIGTFFIPVVLPTEENGNTLASHLYLVWKPFLLGSLVAGIIAAIAGAILMYCLATVFLKATHKQ